MVSTARNAQKRRRTVYRLASPSAMSRILYDADTSEAHFSMKPGCLRLLAGDVYLFELGQASLDDIFDALARLSRGPL
ncbi:hypothetical protein [Bradyrhizobium canariense]|uniref:hypothetical protein n=1 Tax=Bradyrhizobium canariense TaxID=255045 RepID=UPI0013747887|nr:hypothetical protein [Bradyrhizobium canariense]